MVFKHLGTAELRELIGEELLQNIEAILPALDRNLNRKDLNKKKVLAKILSSFTDVKTLKKKDFRRELFLSLPPEEMNNLLSKLNVDYQGASFKEKVSYLTNIQWSKSEDVKKIIDQLGLPLHYTPVKEQERPTFEGVNYTGIPYKTLKDYQSRVFFKSKEQLKQFNRYIIQMPTGSGKTRTTMELICQKLKESETDTSIFWVAHSKELCEQAIQCFKEVWYHIGDSEVQICRIFGNHNALKTPPKGKKFIVGGFQKLFSQYKKNEKLFDKVVRNTKLVVVDEAHKALAPTYKKVTDKLTESYACLIGLTATPGRKKDDLFENKKLAEYFHNTKIAIDTGSNKSVISYLKEKKILSKVKFDELITSNKIKLTSSDLAYLNSKFDFPPSFLKKLGKSKIRNLEILQKLKAYLNEKNQILYFATSLDQSKFINSVVSFLGFKSCHIDGSTDKGTREQNIERFKNKDLQIICNYGVLTTGFDAPQTDLVFIARPTSSIVLYSQMIGRGLRGPAIGGTEECTICTVKDNITGLPKEQRIYEYFDEYFD